MSKLNSNEIIKLLDILIGQTEAVGETNVDNDVYDNLLTLRDVCDYCLDSLAIASRTKDRPEYSMSKIGKTATEYLNSIPEWIEGLEL